MTDDEKQALRQKLFAEIGDKFRLCQHELYEAGVSDTKYQLPPYSDKLSLRRLETVRRSLEELLKGDALSIFRAARNLRPPGVLKQWAAAELTKDARETRIYMAAARLLREVWFANTSLKAFFTVK